MNNQTLTPPPMPTPLGIGRVFEPWLVGRKTTHGTYRNVMVYSQEQLEERDKQWLALLTKENSNVATN